MRCRRRRRRRRRPRSSPPSVPSSMSRAFARHARLARARVLRPSPRARPSLLGVVRRVFHSRPPRRGVVIAFHPLQKLQIIQRPSLDQLLHLHVLRHVHSLKHQLQHFIILHELVLALRLEVHPAHRHHVSTAVPLQCAASMIWQYTAPLAHCSTLVSRSASSAFTHAINSFRPTKNASCIIPVVDAMTCEPFFRPVASARRRRVASRSAGAPIVRSRAPSPIRVAPVASFVPRRVRARDRRYIHTRARTVCAYTTIRTNGH